MCKKPLVLTPLSHADYVVGLHMVLANSTKQVLSLGANESPEQLEMAIKSLLMVKDAAETALPMMRGWLREKRARASGR